MNNHRFQTVLKQHSLIVGLVLMFLYTWTIDLSNSGVLPFKLPFFVYITLGWGFIFVSVFMTRVTLGKDAMIAFLKRFLIWRVDWKWWLVALLLLPVLQFASILLTSWLTRVPMDFSHPMIREVVPLEAPLLALVVPWLVFEILTNGEEWGWRGYVLPRLQAKYNALTSSLILGVIWSVWHLPKFMGTGSGSERSFLWFTLAHLALAVLYTWLYNNTRGSLLLVVLFHATGNTAGALLPVQFAVAGGIEKNMMIVLYILAAVVVAFVAGAKNLSRTEEKQIQE
ncbi:CPBP family intramembrane metalloprotease [Chloroflexi bacterium CFX6]|nr:CPBP family intramembrane metalloprotease [Chloroflexi bacterium CFX6]